MFIGGSCSIQFHLKYELQHTWRVDSSSLQMQDAFLITNYVSISFRTMWKWWGNERVWCHILYRTIWTRHWILWLSCRSGVTSPPGWFWERPPNSNLQNSISNFPPNSTYQAHIMGKWGNERWSSSFDSRKYELMAVNKPCSSFEFPRQRRVLRTPPLHL